MGSRIAPQWSMLTDRRSDWPVWLATRMDIHPRCVWAAIGDLPDRERQVFTGYHFGNRSFYELSREVGMGKASVETLYNRTCLEVARISAVYDEVRRLEHLT